MTPLLQYLAYVLGWNMVETDIKSNVNPHPTEVSSAVRKELQAIAGTDMELYWRGVARGRQQLRAMMMPGA